VWFRAKPSNKKKHHERRQATHPQTPYNSRGGAGVAGGVNVVAEAVDPLAVDDARADW